MISFDYCNFRGHVLYLQYSRAFPPPPPLLALYIPSFSCVVGCQAECDFSTSQLTLPQLAHSTLPNLPNPNHANFDDRCFYFSSGFFPLSSLFQAHLNETCDRVHVTMAILLSNRFLLLPVRQCESFVI